MKASLRGSRYLVCGCTPWAEQIFKTHLSNLVGRWEYVDSPSGLGPGYLQGLNPDYIFFLHWRWKVLEAVTANWECIGFHMTDLPWGRGGTPLQNLIKQGETSTTLTAFRMGNELDAGPIYLKTPDLSLQGTAEEIYIRTMGMAAVMISEIRLGGLEPLEQDGEILTFAQLTPADSEIQMATLARLFDHVRMLDADGYPAAFLEHEGFRFEFTNAVLRTGRIEARAVIRKVPGT